MDFRHFRMQDQGRNIYWPAQQMQSHDCNKKVSMKANLSFVSFLLLAALAPGCATTEERNLGPTDAAGKLGALRPR
jgi:hypothetical protein